MHPSCIAEYCRVLCRVWLTRESLKLTFKNGNLNLSKREVPVAVARLQQQPTLHVFLMLAYLPVIRLTSIILGLVVRNGSRKYPLEGCAQSNSNGVFKKYPLEGCAFRNVGPKMV